MGVFPLDQRASLSHVPRSFRGVNYVQSLQHHRSQAGQRSPHPPAWYGQEKRRGRPTRYRKHASAVLTKFENPAAVGA